MIFAKRLKSMMVSWRAISSGSKSNTLNTGEEQAGNWGEEEEKEEEEEEEEEGRYMKYTASQNMQ